MVDLVSLPTLQVRDVDVQLGTDETYLPMPNVRLGLWGSGRGS